MSRNTHKSPRSAAGAAIAATALFLSGCAGGADETEPRPQGTEPPPGTDAPAQEGSGAGSDADLAAEEFDVTWEEALEAAQAKFDGEPTSISLEWERTEFAYTVELASDTEEYEAEVSATSAEILSESTDRLDDDDVAEARDDVFDPSGVGDVSDAMSAATAEVDGRVAEWDLDKHDGTLLYEFKVLPAGGGDDREVYVDAASGSVVGVDD